MPQSRAVVFERIGEGSAGLLPVKATSQSACFDVYAAEDTDIPSGRVTLVRTGLKAKPPEGTFLEIRPRSGLSTKGVIIVNAPGTIDRDYALEIKVPMTFLFAGSYAVKAGDRIAQMRLVDEVPATCTWGTVTSEGERKGGFGSTGR